jgi:hypothetical protein
MNVKNIDDILVWIGCQLRHWLGDWHESKRLNAGVFIWPTWCAIPECYVYKGKRTAWPGACTIRFAWFEIKMLFRGE